MLNFESEEVTFNVDIGWESYISLVTLVHPKVRVLSFTGKVKDLTKYLNEEIEKYKGEEDGNTNDNDRSRYTNI